MSQIQIPFHLRNGASRVVNSASQLEDHAIDLIINGDPHSIHPDNFAPANHEFVDSLVLRLQSAETVDINISRLPQWTLPFRIAALQFLHRLGHGAVTTVRFQAVAGVVGGDLFGAAVQLIELGNDPSRTSATIQSALIAAVIVYPNASDLRVACNSIASRLRSVGLREYRVSQLIRDAERLAQQIPVHNQATVAPDARQIRAILPDAPVSDDIVIPPGWNLSPQGLALIGGDEGVVVHMPVVVCQILVEVHSGNEWIEIAWFTDNHWVHHQDERSTFSNARLLVQLANRGLAVTTNNAGDLVEYIDDFLAANPRLQHAHVSNRLGWIGDPSNGCFLSGVGPIHRTSEETCNRRRLNFRGADEGDEQVVGAIRISGTLPNWVASMVPLAPHLPIHLAIYAGLASPLLSLIRAQNFLLSFAGQTTCGKTTTLRVAASLWGVPEVGNDSAGNPGFVKSWNATPTFLERAAAILDAHPVLIDDTSLARFPEAIPQVIYSHAQGQGRGRGTTTGLAALGNWRNVTISTGEQSLLSYSQHGGTRARVLEHWGGPFVEAATNVAGTIRDVIAQISDNYGHAGPYFVYSLMQRQSNWNSYVANYQRLQQSYAERAGTNRIAGRLAETFAALHQTAILAHEFDILPWPYQNAIELLWGPLTSETSDDDALRALRRVYDWCMSLSAQFWRGRGTTVPPQGWLGRWDRDGDYLGIFEHRLGSFLRESGFEPSAIIRMWHDRGWLRTNPGRRTLRVRFPDGENPTLIAIQRSSLCESLGIDDDEPPETSPNQQPSPRIAR